MVELGKDCTLSIGGDVTGIVRDVIYNSTSRCIEFQPFGSRRTRSYPVAYNDEIEVILIEDPNLWTALQEGTVVQVSGSGGGGDFVVANVQRSEPLDDIVNFRVRLSSA